MCIKIGGLKNGLCGKYLPSFRKKFRETETVESSPCFFPFILQKHTVFLLLWVDTNKSSLYSLEWYYSYLHDQKLSVLSYFRWYPEKNVKCVSSVHCVFGCSVLRVFVLWEVILSLFIIKSSLYVIRSSSSFCIVCNQHVTKDQHQIYVIFGTPTQPPSPVSSTQACQFFGPASADSLQSIGSFNGSVKWPESTLNLLVTSFAFARGSSCSASSHCAHYCISAYWLVGSTLALPSLVSTLDHRPYSSTGLHWAPSSL